jgi:hypothetical protein
MIKLQMYGRTPSGQRMYAWLNRKSMLTMWSLHIHKPEPRIPTGLAELIQNKHTVCVVCALATHTQMTPHPHRQASTQPRTQHGIGSRMHAKARQQMQNTHIPLRTRTHRTVKHRTCTHLNPKTHLNRLCKHHLLSFVVALPTWVAVQLTARSEHACKP